jgi:RNA polymerase sigma-70 factor (ECF subfamily)
VHNKILDSGFRRNDGQENQVIPGKAVGRDPESRGFSSIHLPRICYAPDPHRVIDSHAQAMIAFFVVTTPHEPSSPAMLAEPEDATLLHELRAGNQTAYETLVRTHSGRLLAVTRRYLHNEEDARDALQDTFLSAFRALHTFTEGSLISTWLHRIAINAALMKLRTRKRRPEESIEDLLPKFLEDGHREDGRPGNPTRPWKEPEGLLQQQETRMVVRACIERLPETYRTVLLLRDIEELDTEQVAQMLEISPNAIKIRLHRARQALRTLLDPHFRTDSPEP